MSANVQEAVDRIGLAVFNGGVTTFLALVLLAGSTSHTFLTFFKVFVLTVVFGLFHGLVLLPVLLSLVGPEMELATEEGGESRSESESSGVSDVSVEEGVSQGGGDGRGGGGGGGVGGGGQTNHGFHHQEEKPGAMAAAWYHKANNCFSPKRGSWSPQGHHSSS